MSLVRNNKIIRLFALFVLFFLVLFFQTSLRGFFYNVSQPLENYFFEAGKKSSDFFEGLFFFTKIKKENQFLKDENEQLLSRLVELEDLRRENQRLRTAFELGIAQKFLLKEARPILRNTDEDFLLINKGKLDGIEKGMTVMNFQNVLVGRIVEVYDKTSKVLLISDQDTKFSVEVKGEKINGLLRGIGQGRVLLDLVPKEEELSSGDLISTAGLEGGFPQGLLVGKIKDIERTDLAPFQKASVEPFFDIAKNTNLLVILKNELD